MEDYDDEMLANFLESEVLSELSDHLFLICDLAGRGENDEASAADHSVVVVAVAVFFRSNNQQKASPRSSARLPSRRRMLLQSPLAN
ncbi:hypothetical protein ACLOJK_034146 [Asimina triloba]